MNTKIGPNIFYRLQQVFIFLAHIFLLCWMIFILKYTADYSTTLVTLNFTGMSLYGGLLIFGTAQWAKRHHLKELKQNIIATSD